MTRRKPTALHATRLTLPELVAKLPEVRQQMEDLLIVAKKVGGEPFADLTECVVGFDDMVDVMSLQLDQFERRLKKLRQQIGGAA